MHVSFSSCALAGALVIALSLTACSHIDNIHEVVPKTVYRSAQLSPAKLEKLIDENGIKSVLNLRGAEPGQPWYDGERAMTAKKSVELHDFALASAREVSPEQAQTLIELMEQAPKPMLIHCWAGADRTGLASALYLYAIENESSDKASSALAFKYHHLSFTSAGAMDRSFDKFVESRAAMAQREKVPEVLVDTVPIVSGAP